MPIYGVCIIIFIRLTNSILKNGYIAEFAYIYSENTNLPYSINNEKDGRTKIMKKLLQKRKLILLIAALVVTFCFVVTVCVFA